MRISLRVSIGFSKSDFRFGLRNVQNLLGVLYVIEIHLKQQCVTRRVNMTHFLFKSFNIMKQLYYTD